MILILNTRGLRNNICKSWHEREQEKTYCLIHTTNEVFVQFWSHQKAFMQKWKTIWPPSPSYENGCGVNNSVVIYKQWVHYLHLDTSEEALDSLFGLNIHLRIFHGCIFFWKILIFPKSHFMRCFWNSKTSSKF